MKIVIITSLFLFILDTVFSFNICGVNYDNNGARFETGTTSVFYIDGSGNILIKVWFPKTFS